MTKLVNLLNSQYHFCLHDSSGSKSPWYNIRAWFCDCFGWPRNYYMYSLLKLLYNVLLLLLCYTQIHRFKKNAHDCIVIKMTLPNDRIRSQSIGSQDSEFYLRINSHKKSHKIPHTFYSKYCYKYIYSHYLHTLYICTKLYLLYCKQCTENYEI